MRRIVIIGNGIAGITAARHIRKRSADDILVISSESDHFFSRTALMYIYMGHMAYENTKPYENFFWEKNRIRLLRSHVEKVDVQGKKLKCQGGRDVPYDVLIIASGSKSNKFGWPGQDLIGVQGLYSLQDLEALEAVSADLKHGVIVGGGLIGVELAEMLHSRGVGVTFLVREKSWMDHILPPDESEMIVRHLKRNGIDLRLGMELDRAVPDARGRVEKIITKDGQEIECQFLGLTVGVGPNIEFLKDSGIECDRGVLVDESLRTNVEDVYAIGDCAQVRQPKPGRRPVEPLWYVGRMMGETVAHTIVGQARAYDPGTWFNSAKFFDIEYQVYGDVKPKLGPGEATLYWEHADGEKSLRINYREADHTLLGFNVMGIRYRHELCEKWINERRPLDYVLKNLGAANFDPEFYAQHEKELVALYRQKHPEKAVRLEKRRGLRGFLELMMAKSGAAA